MRRLVVTILAATVLSGAALAGAGKDEKKDANPCRDQVAAALQKLRKSSWFRMDTSLINEQGPTTMQIDYVLPDRMHQKVKGTLTGQTSEIILVGEEAWSRQNDGAWSVLPNDMTQQLKAQMQESVVEQQAEVGNYTCEGRTTVDGRDVLSYKLVDEPPKESTAPRNEAFRMFYVDPTTGLPVSNALLVPGRDKPIFSTVYAFPLDLKIEAPK